jgi:hypothetical protein
LQNQVNDLVKKHRATMKDELGIDSSVSESDLKKYIREVIDELEKSETEKPSQDRG